MKKMILIFSMCLLTFIVFGQIDSTGTTTEDSTNDVIDWIVRILAAGGILWGGYEKFLTKAGRYGNKAIDLFTEFVNAVDDGRITNPEARAIANKGRDVVKKD